MYTGKTYIDPLDLAPQLPCCSWCQKPFNPNDGDDDVAGVYNGEFLEIQEIDQPGRPEFCSQECKDEDEAERAMWRQQDRYERGDCDFADPGGNSALRAASPSNPRNLPCPNCERPNRLTPADVAHSYQCDDCADQLERGGF